MEEAVYIMDNKGADPVWWNGSYADEVADQSCLLPITVMSFHINLSAIDHSEMASDINWFLRRFLALCAKALIKTNNDLGNIYSHKRKLLVMLESLERLFKSTSSALSLKKEHLPPDKCSIFSSLEERTLKVLIFPCTKIDIIS